MLPEPMNPLRSACWRRIISFGEQSGRDEGHESGPFGDRLEKRLGDEIEGGVPASRCCPAISDRAGVRRDRCSWRARSPWSTGD